MIHAVDGEDIQPPDDEDYTRPFGVPENQIERCPRCGGYVVQSSYRGETHPIYPKCTCTEDKATTLGFKDPAALERAAKRLARKYYPPWYVRAGRWIRRKLFRQRRWS